MQSNTFAPRYEARRLGRQRLLHGLMLLTLVLGVGIIGVAVNMAERVEAFRSTRTGTYWAGVICVTLVVLYIPAHLVSSRRPNHQSGKHMFSFWVFLASFAVVCLFFAAVVAIYYITLINGTDQYSCVYYDAKGMHRQFTNRVQEECHMKCVNKFSGNPKETCCCCHTDTPTSSHYTGIYVQGIDSCSDLFGVVYQSVYALSAINCTAFLVVLVASIVGCGMCCKCCGASQSWTPPTQEVLILTAEPVFHDKAPLMEGHVVGLDVPPAYSSN